MLVNTIRVIISALVCGSVFSGWAQLGRPVTTALTPDNRLLVNGKPTFFIATAPAPPMILKTPEGGDGWAELVNGGLTMVRGVSVINAASPDVVAKNREFMDYVGQRGMYVCPFLGHLVEKDASSTMAQQLKTIIDTFKNHPATFFWKFSDEPEWGKVPIEPLRQAYQFVKKEDPGHLVWITHAPRGTDESLRRYNVACDVLALDIYPISDPPGKHSLKANKSISMVGDYTRQMMNVADGKKMVFMILQVFWSGVNPIHNASNKIMFPTAREERYMTYQAIINGANSLSYFGLNGGGVGIDKELGMNWTYWRTVLKPLLAEIKQGSELYPALTAPDSKAPLKFTGAPRIEARWKEVGDNLYIFAAAREGATQGVKFSGVKDGPVTVVYENRTLEAKNGSFSDPFAEHDVHIYRAGIAGSH